MNNYFNYTNSNTINNGTSEPDSTEFIQHFPHPIGISNTLDCDSPIKKRLYLLCIISPVFIAEPGIYTVLTQKFLVE